MPFRLLALKDPINQHWRRRGPRIIGAVTAMVVATGAAALAAT